MSKVIVVFLISFVATIALMPIFIKLIKKLSCGQTILKYVEEHKAKQGTPTMGGVLFFVVGIILSLIFIDYSTDWFMCLLVGTGFALVGGLDDFLKVIYKRNLGLRPYQKIIGQLGVSIIFAFYVYYKIGTSIVIPFWNYSINLGFFILPLIVLTCLATTNAVNLTDGLDGLASGVSMVIFAVLISIFMILKHSVVDVQLASRMQNLSMLLAIFMGSIMAFLPFNSNKASIFMGDVGSLGIGGLLASIVCLQGLELSLIVVGICFVASTLSVIIQVVYFKKTGKRVFKMAPIHHHFQQSGYSEAKISFCYSCVTLIMGLVLILTYL